MKNPLIDAENVEIKKNRILSIGSKITNLKKVKYQYMGIIFFPKKLRRKIIKNYKLIKNRNKMHITFFLDELIKRKFTIKFKSTSDFWYEFDDYEDYLNFKKFKKFY